MSVCKRLKAILCELKTEISQVTQFAIELEMVRKTINVITTLTIQQYVALDK